MPSIKPKRIEAVDLPDFNASAFQKQLDADPFSSL